jgi:hypothetical protein
MPSASWSGGGMLQMRLLACIRRHGFTEFSRAKDAIGEGARNSPSPRVTLP